MTDLQSLPPDGWLLLFVVVLETVMIRGCLGKVEIGTVGRASEVENVMLTRQLIRMIDAMQEWSHLPDAILNVIEWGIYIKII